MQIKQKIYGVLYIISGLLFIFVGFMLDAFLFAPVGVAFIAIGFGKVWDKKNKKQGKKQAGKEKEKGKEG